MAPAEDTPLADSVLHLSRTLAAPPAKVFRAWTDPAWLLRWWGPEGLNPHDPQVDLRPGGRFRLPMLAPDGTDHVAIGVYEEVVPGERLVFSWGWERDGAPSTRVTLLFLPVGGGTRLMLTHERFATAAARDNHGRGWTSSLYCLEAALEADRGPFLIRHALDIDASPEAIYQAITTGEGLASFWTEDSEAEPVVGSLAAFGFYGRATVFRMRVEALEPGSRVAWGCEAGPGPWLGARLRWQIKARPEGGATVIFTHDGFPAADENYARISATWASVLARLKAAAESGQAQPLFTGRG